MRLVMVGIHAIRNHIGQSCFGKKSLPRLQQVDVHRDVGVELSGRMRGRPTARFVNSRQMEDMSHFMSPVLPIKPPESAVPINQIGIPGTEAEHFAGCAKALGKSGGKGAADKSATASYDDVLHGFGLSGHGFSPKDEIH